MANARQVVIVGAARTAIGTYGGTLKDIPACELAVFAVKEAFARAKVDPASVGQIVLGNVIGPGIDRTTHCKPRHRVKRRW